MRLRGFVGYACASAVLLGAHGASAEPTISGSVDDVQSFLDARRTPVECTEHCFVLDRLSLRGSAKSGVVRFELTGSVLAPGARDIPLFGAQVALTGATYNGRPATIGFDSDWFVHVTERHFTVAGTLTLDDNRELTIRGPVNVVDAQIAGGYVSEGSHFSAATDLVLHIESGEAPAAEPATNESFDLARAVRVADRITFQYRLTLSAGHELGVQKLPLRNGEQVQTVEGAGWSVESGELVLRPAGRAATLLISGELPSLGTFRADSRSASEWLLVESDLDHEVKVQGDATAADVAQSPIHASSLLSRAFRLMPQNYAELSSERRTSHDVLAAVVDRHTRSLVLTASGDLVMGDVFSYDNSALDVVRVHAHGRPIFLSVDGQAERMLHELDPSKEDEIAVPLGAGHHTVRMQSLGQERIAWLGGRLKVPMPEQPLTTSTDAVEVGLPEHVHPIAATGGEKAKWLAGSAGDLAAVAAAIALSFIVFGRRRSRLVGAFAAAGVWFIAPLAFLLGISGLALLAGGRAAATRLTGWPRRFAFAFGAVALTAAAVFALRATASSHAADAGRVEDPSVSLMKNLATTTDAVGGAGQGVSYPAPPMRLAEAQSFGLIGLHASGNQESAGDGVLGSSSTLKGVTPVELPMPGSARVATLEREIVTSDRPFVPVVWYVTDAFLWLLTALWAASVGWLTWTYRASLMRLRERLRAPFAAAPAVTVTTPCPPGEPFR